jgi:hypothetical protein
MMHEGLLPCPQRTAGNAVPILIHTHSFHALSSTTAWSTVRWIQRNNITILVCCQQIQFQTVTTHWEHVIMTKIKWRSPGQHTKQTCKLHAYLLYGVALRDEGTVTA